MPRKTISGCYVYSIRLSQEIVDLIDEQLEKMRQEMPMMHITATDVIRANILSDMGYQAIKMQ